MGIKPDHWIRRMATNQKMIEPFVENSMRQGVISYGVSSYGYDIRVSNEFKIFTNVNSAVVDPKQFVLGVVYRLQGRRLHHPAQLVCAVAHG